jgi:hypothetical protein
MKYSSMARIAKKMQSIVEFELKRLHKEHTRNAKPVSGKIDFVKKRASLIVLKGGKPG